MVEFVMEWGKTVFVVLLVTGIALIFPILYTDVIAYNSNITLGPVIEQFPLVFIVIFAVFVIGYGWEKRHG